MRQHAAPLILIIIVSGGVFANALRSEFVWDDYPVIVTNEHIRDLRASLRFFTPGYWQMLYVEDRGMRGRAYRPTVELSFAAQYAIWKLNDPIGWHITSILWHAFNCVLVYVLAHRILADKRTATFCALLFAVHPIHVEAVVWAKAQSELLAFTLMLATALLYLRSMDSSAPTRGSVCLYLCSVLAFGVALSSKASAMVLPPLLALYVWCFLPPAGLRAALLALAPFAGIAIALMALDSLIPPMGLTVRFNSYQHLLAVLGTVGIYLRLLLLPVGLCLHHRHPAVGSLLQPEPLTGLILSLVLLGGIVVAFRRSKTAFFALGWLLIGILPAAAEEIVEAWG